MKKHRKTIHANYASAKFYDTYKEDILDIYNKEFDTISELNIYAIKEICKILDINTKFVNSKNLKAPGKKDTRVINICKEIGADYYLSGPAAKDYIDKEKFEKADIKLEYKKYGGYPEYKQLWDGFTHYVSIIDLIFNCGEKSPYYIWG